MGSVERRPFMGLAGWHNMSSSSIQVIVISGQQHARLLIIPQTRAFLSIHKITAWCPQQSGHLHGGELRPSQIWQLSLRVGVRWWTEGSSLVEGGDQGRPHNPDLATLIHERADDDVVNTKWEVAHQELTPFSSNGIKPTTGNQYRLYGTDVVGVTFNLHGLNILWMPLMNVQWTNNCAEHIMLAYAKDILLQYNAITYYAGTVFEFISDCRAAWSCATQWASIALL